MESGKAMIQTLVMIPGLGSDAAIWRRTIAALDGAVDCLVGDTLSDDTLQGMARRILDQAPETFALAGVSMGGMVALQIMRIAPHRVTRLALIDTNARHDTVMRKAVRYLSNFAAAIASDFDKLSKRSVSSLIHRSTPEDIRTEIARMGARVGARCYIRQNRAAAARKDLRPILRSITVPTAVIVGSADTVTPVKLSQEIHDLTPMSTLHIIPDCGHLPPIEKPADLAVILLKLMR
jgi:pimeloyl-ACP methyl ester carboxylesterase